MNIASGNKKWQTDSWRNFPIKQQPQYENLQELKKTEEQLANFAPLTSISEIERLKSELALVADGKAFLLQGGDCAESFAEFSGQNIKSFVRTFLQMTVALMYGLKKPIVKVGRIAGQYAKPRSEEFETINGVTLPSYKGDNVNSIEFSQKARQADPRKLIEAYFYSAASLNHIRSLTQGGYAALDNVSIWNEEYILNSNSRKNIKRLINNINQALGFVEACGINKSSTEFSTANFYTSHEALILNYEQAFVKEDRQTKQFYDLSAHMLWIGDRTRSKNEAHVEFMRGLSNPIAFKVGPSILEDDLISLIDILNPKNEAGKITLISRMGANKINDYLPKLISRVQKEGKKVIWSCDPMHGNTIKSSNNYKTRKFDDILSEIKSFFEIHHHLDSYAGGVHLEMTGQNVTECLGGNQEILETNLQDRYHTHCDPRLNSSQSIELAFLIAEGLK
jgi:3-deoxy-7-phosphoheptulonate synthase